MAPELNPELFFDKPDLTGESQLASAFNYGDLKKNQSSDGFDYGDLKPAKPEGSLGRWFGALIEGSKDQARWLARSGRLHTLYGYFSKDEPSFAKAAAMGVPAYAATELARRNARRTQALQELKDERPDFEPDENVISNRIETIKDMERRAAADWWWKVEKAEFLQTAPEFEGVSSGFLEDALRAIPSSITGIVPMALHPVAGAFSIYHQMHGAISEGIEKQGGTEERAHLGGQRGSLLSLPLEMLGDALQLKAMFPRSGRWAQRFILGAEAFGGQAFTEYAQQYPETSAMVWALNPDLTPNELISHMKGIYNSADFQKDALYSGLVGGVSAGITVGVAQTIGSTLDYLVSDKQKQINNEKSKRFAEIVSKENPTVEDVQELAGLTGMPRNIMDKLTGQLEKSSIKDTVEKIKSRVLFQSEPIKSEARERIKKAVESHKGFNKENVEAYMGLWDGIAYSMFESGDIKSPEEFYDLWKYKVENQAEISDKEGMAFQKGPGDITSVNEYPMPEAEFRIKPPKKLYRGEFVHEDGSVGFGTYNLGKGIYSTQTKSFAKKYGKVVELSPEEVFPMNPLVLQPIGDPKGAFADWVLKNSEFKNIREFNKAYPDPGLFVRGKGYDGVIVGDEIVKYPTEEQPLKPEGGKEAKEKAYEKAASLGYSEVLTHNSPDASMPEIRKRSGAFEKFNGIFTTRGWEGEYGNGAYDHHFVVKPDKIAGHGDIDFDYDKTIDFLKKEYPELNEDELNTLYDLTAGDESIDNADSNPLERYGFDDLGNAGWELQDIRGKIAILNGFDAVKVKDEFGTSIFLPAGTNAKNLEDPLFRPNPTSSQGDGSIVSQPGKAGDVLYQSAPKTPTWHSAMTSFLSQKLPNTGTPESFSKTIESWVNKGEFKQEEYEWSGLQDWLKTQSGKVTKQQVIDYLKENTSNQQQIINSQAPLLELPMDGTAVFDTKFLGDIVKSEAFKSEGFSGLDIPTQRKVLDSMRTASLNREIRNAIIKLIPVDVVNNFIRGKRSSELPFHNQSVLSNLLTMDSEGTMPLSSDVANSLVKSVASLTAKIDSAISGSRDIKNLSALLAGYIDSIPGVFPGTHIRAEKRGRFLRLVSVPNNTFATDSAIDSMFSSSIASNFGHIVSPSEVKNMLNTIPKQGINSKEEKDVFLFNLTITPEMKQKALSEGMPLFQDKRGAIKNLFTDNPAIIQAFKDADPSTPIHETGHLLTKLLQKHRPEDYKVLAEWAGVHSLRAQKGLESWTEEELEKVATGFERYVMDGQAPTMRLQPIFRKFKQWLIRIYKTIKSLDVEISPEVADVFDRLVSTQEERANDPVYEVVEWYNVNDPAFSMPSESDLSEYENIAAKAHRKAVERLKEKRAKIEKELEVQFKKSAQEYVDELDIYDVINEIVASGGLNYGEILSRYGKGTVESLQARRIGLVGKDGEMPDRFAHDRGYDPDELINEILASKPKAEAVEYFKDQMWAEYWSYANAEDIDTYNEVLDAEIEIINELLGDKPKARKELKGIIREKTGQVKPEDYRRLRSEFKYTEKIARQAYNAAMKDIKTEKDFEKAKQHQADYLKRLEKLREVARLKHEQKKRLANIRQAANESRERSKINRRMKRYLKMGVKHLPVDYKEQVIDVLNNYYLLPAKYQNMKPVETLESLLDRAEAEGENVDVPRMIARHKMPDPRSKGETMRLEDLQIVAQLVDSIVHLGKTKGKLIGGQQIIDLNNKVDELVAHIFGKHAPDPEKTPWEVIDADRKKRQSVEHMKAFFMEELDQPEFITRALDGWEDLGPVWSSLLQPIKQAWDNELELGAQLTNKIRTAFDRAGADSKWAKNLVEITWTDSEGNETALTRPKEEVFMIALNSGNEGNRAALIQGYGFTDEQISAMWDSLTPKEKQLANDIWEILDSLFPTLEEVHLKHTGARLVKVDGQYFPLAFNRALSKKADRFAQEKELKDLFASEYHMTRPEWGHRKERTGGKMAPLLTLNVIQNHIQKTVHDITHQLAIRDVQKIVAHSRFRDAVERTLGERTYRQLMPWLQHVARPNEPQDVTGVDYFWRKLRATSTVVALGIKISTALKQQLGLTQTIHKVGLMNTLGGLKKFYRNPQDAIAKVNELSIQMRYRKKSWDRDIVQLYGQFDPHKAGWTEEMKEAFFYLITLNDLAVSYPSWIAAYGKGLRDFNQDQEKAVEYADMIVRNTQASASPFSLSMFQRGGRHKSEGTKILGMFYTSFATFRNNIREINRRYGAGDINTVELFKAYWWYLVLPAVMEGVISRLGISDDDDESLKDIGLTVSKDIIGYYSGGIPVLRDVVNGVMSDWGYDLTPAAKAVDVFTETVKGVASGEKYWKSRRPVKHTIDLLGYGFGLPSAQMKITLDGILDLATDETNDYTRLFLSKGKIKKKNKYRVLE